jgi:hypothetical protein
VPRNRLWKNLLVEDGGTRLAFTDVTEAAGVGDTGCGMGCAVGDIDNDGDPDLYVTNCGPNVLYENQGDGTFRDITARAGVADPRFSSSAAFLDHDRDGRLDLFVASYVEFSIASNRECSRLGGRRDYCGPLSYEPAPDRLFHNEGGGTFRDVTRAAGIDRAFGNGLGVVCADFDGDSWIDIFVDNDATANQLWINRGDGTFEDRALVSGVATNAAGQYEAGMGACAGDFDRDGDFDIFSTHERDETNTLWVHIGAGLFEDATARLGLAAPSLPYTGFGAAWVDFDRDGWLDLSVANGAVRALPALLDAPHPYHQPDQLFRNTGGRFVEVTVGAELDGGAPLTGRGLAAGDLDNDGDVDLVVTNNSGPLRVLRNDTPTRGGWLALRLVGTRSGRDAYGSMVAVELDGGARLTARAGTDGGYLSASDPRLYFGLGDAKSIAAVTVRWTSGRVERWRGIEPGKLTTLSEGEGTPVE